MKRVLVIFPGIGYGIEKPLLYYSNKIAYENGYEPIYIEYNGLEKYLVGSREKMLEAFAVATRQAEEQLSKVDFASCEDIIFASKSIGTVAASIYATKYKIPARQVYYTPFPQTFSLAQEGNGLVFFGDNDPWIDVETIRELCNSKKCNTGLSRGQIIPLKQGMCIRMSKI
ncbi:MAG: alpha/beta hydrolase [Lachnospiraceae bacterium]|nr:alpha/beta hydrolase [Lachnospiraceae bacterium]